MAAAQRQSRARRRICVMRATGGFLAGDDAGVHPILPVAREPWMTTPAATTADQAGPEATCRKQPGWGAALALAGAILAVLLALASRTTLWDRDEPRFAQATVEMIASGDYLVPTFNGGLRADKPILAYWWMSLPVRLLGPTAVAARLWSAAAMAIATLLTFATARRLLPARAGLWAMAVMAASPLAIVEGQAATTDAVLLAAVTAAMACCAAALIPGAGGMATLAERRMGGHGSPWPWLGLGVALGLA